MTDAGPQSAGRLSVAIRQGSAALARPVDEDQADRLARLVEELERWNRRVNLTAIRDPHDMLAGHIFDSLVAAPLLKGTRILDVGTGGGFPGLPLAIVSPRLNFTLLDSNGKKINFVRHVIGELELDNVEAVKSRVETYRDVPVFDTVIARAFAALPKMLQLTRHLVGKTGVLLALKGKYPAAELEELRAADAPWDIEVTQLNVPGLEQHERHAVTLSRQLRERP